MHSTPTTERSERRRELEDLTSLSGPADLAALAALAGAHASSAAQPVSLARPPWREAVASDGAWIGAWSRAKAVAGGAHHAELVGCVGVRPGLRWRGFDGQLRRDSAAWQVVGLFVAPAQRGRGLAARLLDAALATLRLRGQRWGWALVTGLYVPGLRGVARRASRGAEELARSVGGRPLGYGPVSWGPVYRLPSSEESLP